MESKQVSKKLLVRLPVYLEYLKSLPEDVENISATRIAEALALGDVMVRKDLAKVSCGGRRKLGYPRAALIRDIEKVLELNTGTGVVVVGTNRLGRALLDYEGFEEAGLDVLAGFDPTPPRGKTQTGKPIYHLDGLEVFCRLYHVRIGILTVPSEQAQQVCDRLVDCGVGAVWNFTPAELTVPEGVLMKQNDLVRTLAVLHTQLEQQGS